MNNIYENCMSDEEIKKSCYLKLYSDDKIYWETILNIIDLIPFYYEDFEGNTPDELKEKAYKYYSACRYMDYCFTTILPALVKAEELIKSKKIEFGCWDNQWEAKKYPLKRKARFNFTIDKICLMLDSWLDEAFTLWDMTADEGYDELGIFMHKLVFDGADLMDEIHDLCLDAIAGDPEHGMMKNILDGLKEGENND